VLLGGEVWVGCETPEPVGRETERAARVGDGATWVPSYGQMVRSWGGGGGGAVELWPKGSTCCRVACAGDEVRLACRVSACQAAAWLAWRSGQFAPPSAAFSAVDAVQYMYGAHVYRLGNFLPSWLRGGKMCGRGGTYSCTAVRYFWDAATHLFGKVSSFGPGWLF
jgi:hypothetical protein